VQGESATVEKVVLERRSDGEDRRRRQRTILKHNEQEGMMRRKSLVVHSSILAIALMVVPPAPVMTLKARRCSADLESLSLCQNKSQRHCYAFFSFKGRGIIVV